MISKPILRRPYEWLVRDTKHRAAIQIGVAGVLAFAFLLWAVYGKTVARWDGTRVLGACIALVCALLAAYYILGVFIIYRSRYEETGPSREKSQLIVYALQSVVLLLVLGFILTWKGGIFPLIASTLMSIYLSFTSLMRVRAYSIEWREMKWYNGRARKSDGKVSWRYTVGAILSVINAVNAIALFIVSFRGLETQIVSLILSGIINDSVWSAFFA